MHRLLSDYLDYIGCNSESSMERILDLPTLWAIHVGSYDCQLAIDEFSYACRIV
jgi:hypothetical protein